MRIGEPARRHGVSDDDIEHAIRNAIRQHVGDEFAMLIGLQPTAHCLRSGSSTWKARTQSSSMPCQQTEVPAVEDGDHHD